MTPKAQVQLTLDLPFEEAMGVDDYIVAAPNERAYDFISNWPEWSANVAVLCGPSGSGKTHLANIWANLSGARQHKAKNLSLDLIPEWLESNALVLEDVQVGGFDEAALFHLVNAVRGSSAHLLITTDEPFINWGLQTADLTSRLRAAVPIEIATPDDTLMRQVFVKQFSDRQIIIEPNVIGYLILRIERSLNAVREVVNVLDEAAFSKGRPITKRFAADVLEF